MVNLKALRTLWRSPTPALPHEAGGGRSGHAISPPPRGEGMGMGPAPRAETARSAPSPKAPAALARLLRGELRGRRLRAMLLFVVPQFHVDLATGEVTRASRDAVVDGVLDRLDLFGSVVRDVNVELFFQLHNQLDCIQRVRAKIVHEGRFTRYFFFFDTGVNTETLAGAATICTGAPAIRWISSTRKTFSSSCMATVILPSPPMIAS